MAAMLGIALGASADPANRWIEVDGGSWHPDSRTLSRLKQQIKSFVIAGAKAQGRKLPEWKTFTFQYQGQGAPGGKYVFVNVFCIDEPAWPLQKRFMQVTDGGTCFFNVNYNPATNQFFGLLMHRDA